MNFDVEEADRQMLCLSLALCSLLRPGFEYACGEIAEKLQGRAMFADFRHFNMHSVKRQDIASGTLGNPQASRMDRGKSKK
jgi:hypothetical protein